jgi:hypothetical protein
VNFLLPSERVRGELGWGKKFTTPARIAINLLACYFSYKNAGKEIDNHPFFTCIPAYKKPKLS